VARGLRRIEPASLPRFLGIGAPQSGTTWLHENLRCHAELWLPRRKEIHFFDRNFHRGPSWYAAHFRDSGDRLAGEITPSYGALSHRRIRDVRELLPEVRLIYVLRNPVERAWSRARRRFARTGGDPRRAPDLAFLQALEAEQSIEPGDYEPGVMKGDHARILDHWLAEFPAERLLVVRFEDVSARPRALLAAVFRHLGVSADVDWSALPWQRVVNRNPPAPMPSDCRAFLEERYRSGVEALQQRLGIELASWRV
jgi:hypothetical protein